jgi:dihydroorotate dehydrogenase (NAD+) catalytic subunit
MNPLEVNIGDIKLTSPVIAASGTFGYGNELAVECDLSSYGAIVTKAITLNPKEGNPPPRIWETPSGMLNAIGLQNVGVDVFVKSKLPQLKQLNVPIAVNVAGVNIDEYKQVCQRLADFADDIIAIELNVSCPNVEEGCLAFGARPDLTAELVKVIRPIWPKSLWVKLSPNVGDMVPVARAATDAGADVLTLINTFFGLAIDPYSRKPRIANVTGGLSGPAIKPAALYHTWKVASEVSIPVIGMGGISTAEDVVEFMLAGAAAVQIGTVQFQNPYVVEDIRQGLLKYAKDQDLETISDIIGKFEVD